MSSKHEHDPEIGEVTTPEGDAIGYFRKQPGQVAERIAAYLKDTGYQAEPSLDQEKAGFPTPPFTAPWSRARLFTFMRTHVERCIQLAERKNNDYTGASEDAFFNLRRGGPFGVAVRLDDKVSRLLSLLKDGLDPKVGESLEDTVDDVINYGLLLRGLLEEKRR